MVGGEGGGRVGGWMIKNATSSSYSAAGERRGEMIGGPAALQWLCDFHDLDVKKAKSVGVGEWSDCKHSNLVNRILL